MWSFWAPMVCLTTWVRTWYWDTSLVISRWESECKAKLGRSWDFESIPPTLPFFKWVNWEGIMLAPWYHFCQVSLLVYRHSVGSVTLPWLNDFTLVKWLFFLNSVCIFHIWHQVLFLQTGGGGGGEYWITICLACAHYLNFFFFIWI